MSDKKITPGCLCMIIGLKNLAEFNGIFVTAIRYVGKQFCECGCGKSQPDAWEVESLHTVVRGRHGWTNTEFFISAKYLLPIPGDMPPPESLRRWKPVPDWVED